MSIFKIFQEPIFVLAIFLLLFVLLWIVFVKLGRQPDKYDERQQVNRCKAYKSAFFTVCIWNCLYYAVKACGLDIPVEDSLMAIGGVIAGTGVYAISCIFTDAYFPINRSSVGIIVGWLVIALVNIFLGIWNIRDGSMITDGRLNIHAASVFVGILLLAVAVASLIRRSVCKNDESE